MGVFQRLFTRHTPKSYFEPPLLFIKSMYPPALKLMAQVLNSKGPFLGQYSNGFYVPPVLDFGGPIIKFYEAMLRSLFE